MIRLQRGDRHVVASVKSEPHDTRAAQAEHPARGVPRGQEGREERHRGAEGAERLPRRAGNAARAARRVAADAGGSMHEAQAAGRTALPDAGGPPVHEYFCKVVTPIAILISNKHCFSSCFESV